MNGNAIQQVSKAKKALSYDFCFFEEMPLGFIFLEGFLSHHTVID